MTQLVELEPGQRAVAAGSPAFHPRTTSGSSLASRRSGWRASARTASRSAPADPAFSSRGAADASATQASRRGSQSDQEQQDRQHRRPGSRPAGPGPRRRPGRPGRSGPGRGWRRREGLERLGQRPADERGVVHARPPRPASCRRRRGRRPRPRAPGRRAPPPCPWVAAAEPDAQVDQDHHEHVAEELVRPGAAAGPRRASSGRPSRRSVGRPRLPGADNEVGSDDLPAALRQAERT